MFDFCVNHDIDDSGTVLQEKIVTARKEHKCVECGEVIKKGDKFEYIFMRFDDDPIAQAFKTCLPCHGIRRDMFPGGAYFGFVWPDLIEAIRDRHHDENPEILQAEINAIVPEKWRKKQATEGTEK